MLVPPSPAVVLNVTLGTICLRPAISAGVPLGVLPKLFLTLIRTNTPTDCHSRQGTPEIQCVDAINVLIMSTLLNIHLPHVAAVAAAAAADHYSTTAFQLLQSWPRPGTVGRSPTIADSFGKSVEILI